MILITAGIERVETVKDYWRKRVENLDSEVPGDEPWFSARDREQTRRTSFAFSNLSGLYDEDKDSLEEKQFEK